MVNAPLGEVAESEEAAAAEVKTIVQRRTAAPARRERNKA